MCVVPVAVWAKLFSSTFTITKSTRTMRRSKINFYGFTHIKVSARVSEPNEIKEIVNNPTDELN